ncbi:MAG: PQQ-dependent sugar dehydrogenase [Anaerolineae bacterium]|nr:PQQ-dependent sugar dehydrogenase [Anaerolineae bacterium]
MTRLIGLLLLVMMIILPVSAQDEPIIAVETPPTSADVALERISLQLDGSAYNPVRPLFITNAGDDTDRLFLVLQGGRIFVMQNGEYILSEFLDLTDLVSAEANSQQYSERGLLGLAFHPDYAENGYFFVNYTDRQGTTHIVRYSVSADAPNVADPNSAVDLFQQTQPFPNHNGGVMAFGPDGYLYVSLGDGGSANDPLAAGQNPTTLLGTIMRLNVDGEDGYTIPEDNPFVGSDRGADEVWAYGLRNVWRFSFDRATGDFYIGDVGQNQWEEINFQSADSPGGENYGWNIYEATHQFSGGPIEGVIWPIAEYSHSLGCSVTGGYVYRGGEVPALQGVYLYSDYCSGRIWMAYRDANMEWHTGDVLLESGLQVSSFGEDEQGELFVIDYGGGLYRFVESQ